jgi:glycosyltransferase involved in cell wall biosynthesis
VASVRSLCIAVPTFKRLDLLGALLDDLAEQVLKIAPLRAELLVIDNDPDGAAREIVRSRRASFPCRLHYANVRTPGLSAVRNYSLEFALAADVDSLAMIDDDERPSPDWLRALIDVSNASGADVVSGPVLPIFASSPPQWVLEGGFFSPPSMPDGAWLTDCYSNNALLRTASLRSRKLRFDPRLGLAGGEDQLFFRQFVKAGGTIVYCERAFVTERIPPTRTTVRYVLRRSLRRGTTLSICDANIHGTFRMLALRSLKALGALIRGTVEIAFARGKAGVVSGVCEVARGFGMVIGLFGRTIQEYAGGHDATKSPAGLDLDLDPRDV